MPVIRFETRIHAPIERCFDLARSIDLHIDSTPGSSERAIAGRTAGLIALGELVTWEARHLGVRQKLTSRIAEMDRPRHFQDSQVDGAFEGSRTDTSSTERSGEDEDRPPKRSAALAVVLEADRLDAGSRCRERGPD